MAFEDNLPVGSTPFSNTLYKDPSDRIWTGDPFQSEFYRFLDRSEVEFIYVNIKDFGAVGDGVTDDTEAFENALDEAKSSGNYLYFPDGTYPVTVSEDTIDMNGCLGLVGKGTILVTSTGNPDRPLMKWEGEKVRVGSNIPVVRGQKSFTIDTGLDIKKGDTVFLISAELIYPDVDTRYTKGNRFTVDTYNPSTGAILFYEVSYFDIASGFFWLNTVRPKVMIQDVTIEITGDVDKKGVEVILGEFYILTAKITGFGRFCANISSSFGRVFASQFAGELITGTTTGYSIQASGLSDIFIEGCNLYGSRHGIACGDVGYWQAADADAAPTPVPWIRLPAIVKMTGSRIAGSAYAVDSHAGTVLLDVYNCDIYGGAQVGGLETYITNSRIYQEPAQVTTLWFGRDRPNVSGAPFVGKYAVRNCQIHAVTGVVHVFSNIEHLEISDLVVNVSASASARNMISYTAVSEVKYLTVEGLRHIGNAGDNVTYPVQVSVESKINDLFFENAGLLISVRRNTVGAIRIDNSSISKPGGNAVFIGALSAANRTFNITMTNTDLKNSDNGIRITRAASVNIVGGSMSGNTATVVLQSNSVGAMTSVISGVYFNQASGDVIATENGQVVSLVLVGNTFTAANGINVPNTVTAKYGNIGLDDKLKTALTTTTTSRYGADDTSGDLTLN